MTRPIERYVRAAAEIRMPAANVPGAPRYIVAGTVELGLHYERGESPGVYRPRLIKAAEATLGGLIGWAGPIHEDLADEITEDLDARLVAVFGDRPRFIEVWCGTGDDAEPLTQVYAPHGLPRELLK